MTTETEKLTGPRWERATYGRAPKMPYCTMQCSHYTHTGRLLDKCAMMELPTEDGMLCEPTVVEFFGKFRDFLSNVEPEFTDTY